MNNQQTIAWKQALFAEWLNLDVPKFFQSIGIDFTLKFEKSLSESKQQVNPYRDHTWLLMPNSQIPEGVLHVYPNQIPKERIIWEEWFLLNGELRHHVLSNHSFEQQDGVWQSEPDDTDHPLITVNRKWNYKIEKSLIPFLL
jgi:hypothetical protein